VATAKSSAEIVDMADARARLAADAGEFEHVGARLTAVRESRGVGLREAAARTHIRENHLQAIENVDAKGLPARPYALGFVRTYAEFLGQDARAIVEQFKFDAGYDSPAPMDAEKFRTAEEAAEAQTGELSLPIFIVIAAFIIWCAWQITLTSKVSPIGEALQIEAPSPVATPALEPVQGVLIEAKVLDQIDPVYPRSCTPAAQPVETVTLAFTVTSAGRVASERVASSTNGCFNEAALNALRRWSFEPRTIDGAARPAFDQLQVFRFNRP
jgi:TonB family protein